MINIRFRAFETNSSSCHAMVHLTKDELQKFAANWYTMVVHIPDCEGHHEEDIGHDYQLLDNEDAMALYNKAVDCINETCESSKKGQLGVKLNKRKEYKKFDDEEKFFDAVENETLENNDVFGRYLTFQQFMSYAVIKGDMEFDVQWWNNC